MIGDELVADVSGARKFGIDQVYFNPMRIPHSDEVTYEIRSLLELKEIL
jgi:putative hydrolase of the HAD superfamily